MNVPLLPNSSLHFPRSRQDLFRCYSHKFSALFNEPARATQSDKYLFLDGLRGVAVFSVIMQHANCFGNFYSTPFQQSATSFVWGFFVLSSFLLTRNLMKRLKTTSSRLQIILTDYAIRRFLRVYPFYAILWIIQRYFSMWAPGEGVGWTFESADYSALFLFRSLGPTWTVPVEMQAYLLIPNVAILRHYVGFRASFGLTFVYTQLHCILFPLEPGIPFYHMGLSSLFPVFLYGAMAALLFEELKDKKFSIVARRMMDYAVWILFALFLYISSASMDRLYHVDFVRNHPLTQGPLFAFIILLGMLTPAGTFGSVFSWSLLTHVGKVSYSMYLTHLWPIWWEQLYFGWGKEEGMWVIYVLNIFLATICYHIIEVPCQHLVVYLCALLRKYQTLKSEY